MSKDFDNHRRIFDGGDALQAAAAVRAVFDVDVEDPFEQPGPTQARRRVIACGRKAREVRTSTSYPTVHLRFDIHASSLLGEIKPPLIASRQAHPPMPSSLEAPSSNGEAPDQKRRGQRKTTQPAASNRLMGLLRRYTRVRIHPNRVLLRPAPMSSSHCFALAKRSCGMRLADTTGSG